MATQWRDAIERVGQVNEISKLKVANQPYIGDLYFMIVSVHFLPSVSKLNVTDFSSHPKIGTDRVREHFITHYSERLPLDQMMQLSLDNNSLETFLKAVNESRGIVIPHNVKSCDNIADQCVLAKASVRFKMYGGFLEGWANHIELLDLEKGNVNQLHLPIYQNLLSTMPHWYLEGHIQTFAKSIPKKMIMRCLRGEKPYYVPSRSTSPAHTPSRARPLDIQRASKSRNSIPPQPHHNGIPDEIMDEAEVESSPFSPTQVKLSSVAGLPDDDTHSQDFESDQEESRTHETQVQTSVTQYRHASRQTQKPAHTQIRPTEQDDREPEPTFIERINTMKTIDDKVIKVQAVIVDFEPLSNQLCVKSDANKPPILNPLSIIARGPEIDRSPGENKFLRISFTNLQEIFNFLGMDEVEEIYIKAKNIYSKFKTIIDARFALTLTVSRRKVKVNNFGNYIYGWELIGMTLDDIYNQCI